MSKFHKLKVAEVRKETADSVSITFDVPASLKNDYKFIQGQYLTLKLNVKGEEIRRSYSICSGVGENELRVAVKRVKGGKGSNHLNESVKAGDEMEVMVPMGGFHSPMNASHKKNYVLIAGGSGITPMFSIIKTVLTAEPHSTLQLFYGNLNEAATIFKAQLDELAAKNASRLDIKYILDSPAGPLPDLQKGIMTADKLKAIAAAHIDLKKDNEFFICGPGPMMENAKTVLLGAGVDKSRVHIEYFTAAPVEPGLTEVPTGDKVMSKVTVIMDGTETHLDLASNGKVILDAALDAGVDVPFACKGAVCATCRARVLEGKVKMRQNFALTDSEVADGFILTCQSHPASEKVVVDYDV